MKKLETISRYIKRNFASSKLDLTINTFLLFIIWSFLVKIIYWIRFNAEWDIVTKNFPLYLFGSYPKAELWRPTLWISVIITLIIVTLSCPRKNNYTKLLPIIWILIVPLGIFLLAGGIGITPVASTDWGGITLTLCLTLSSGLLSLPLGILLAIGRQSNLFAIRKFCKLYIEFMRAMPLIAVLFFGQLLIPIFLPMGLEINRVMRAVLAFSLFTASYIAEDIRGGLQAIPNTQNEAAAALGLDSIQTFQLIIMPQAIKISLPALTNQAIGLLQNTSLMSILGLVEIFGISRSLLANPNFIGKYLEGYVWLACIYWLICTLMALLSKNLESKLNTDNI